MKTNKAILCAAVALAFLPARAQKPEGDLNREMEVTREYEPSVDAASKLGVKPNMVDTVALRPEVDFSVTPRPVTQGVRRDADQSPCRSIWMTIGPSVRCTSRPA